MKYQKQLYWLILFVFIYKLSLANDTLVMGQLIRRIANLQCKESSVFPKGIMPCYRLYALNKNREKADITNFFTGLVDMTLRDIAPQLTQYQQEEAKQIIIKSLEVFPKFLHQKGNTPTYNFWPTDTPKIFPNSGWINLFDKKKALPDDLDCTVIALLALNSPKSTAISVHNHMQQFVNSPEKRIRNTFKSYQEIGAYSTWFGKKMPIDFDISVLSNVLYFVQKYHLSWTRADTASLELIVRMVKEKKHIKTPVYISPYYNTTPVILYHIARLMSVTPIPELEKLKPQLIEEAEFLYSQSNQFMEEIILSSALLRWSGKLPPQKTHYTKTLQTLIEENSFALFIGNMGSFLPDPWKRWSCGIPVQRFYFNCEAYNNLLVLEYLALKRKYDK